MSKKEKKYNPRDYTINQMIDDTVEVFMAERAVSAKVWANPEFSLFDSFLVFLTLGKPKIIIPAGINTSEKTIAINTPNAVKIPKYFMG